MIVVMQMVKKITTKTQSKYNTENTNINNTGACKIYYLRFLFISPMKIDGAILVK